jgi:uncharacterized protein DUF1963
VTSARVFGVLFIGWMLAACDSDSKRASAAPVESARPAAAVVVLAGRPKHARLPARVAALAETALALSAETGADLKLRVGASKIGGLPDLPRAMAWPTVGGRPLAFLAQLDLSEVSRHLEGSGLPEEGLLSFFYDAAQQPDGYRPADRDGFRVFHSSGSSNRLWRATPPPGLEPPPFPVRTLSFKTEKSYPDLGSYAVRKLALGASELEDYREFLAGLAQPSPDHRLLGHPEGTLSDVQSSSQFVSNGLDLSEGVGEDDARARALEPGSGDWRLLLKLDSDEKAGMDWGEGGQLYFMIRRQDLQAKNFKAVWLILDTD